MQAENNNTTMTILEEKEQEATANGKEEKNARLLVPMRSDESKSFSYKSWETLRKSKV